MAVNHVELSAGNPPSTTIRGSIFDIQRFSIHDGPGIRTTVFFKGCLLHCPWCSNPESQSTTRELLYSQSNCLKCGRCVAACPEGALALGELGVLIDRGLCSLCDQCLRACPSGAMRVAGRQVTAAEVLEEVARDAVFYRHSQGGMTLSGGEPLLQPEFACALLEAARALGFHTAVETNGFATEETLREVLGRTDLILYDVKQLDPASHRGATGESNAAILRNARAAASLGINMVMRVPVIPGFNDDAEQITAIGHFARDLGLSELHLLPYHNYSMGKYAALERPYEMIGAASPSTEQLNSYRDHLQTLGLRVAIGG